MLDFRAYTLFQMTETFVSLTIFLASLENICIESQLWVYSPMWQLLVENEQQQHLFTKEYDLQFATVPTIPQQVPLIHFNFPYDLLAWPLLKHLGLRPPNLHKDKSIQEKTKSEVNQGVLMVKNLVAKDKLSFAKIKCHFLVPTMCLLEAMEPQP